VSAQDLTGKRFTINISGFPARVFQHEYDHLQAVLYCDRMVPEAMKENRAKFVEMEEAFLKNNPSTEIRRVK
jgi:peptide deformylase